MLRALTKTGFAAGMHWSGLDRLMGARRGLENLPLIVTYHRVVEDFDQARQNAIAPMLVSTRTLERHLDWIGRRYDFVSLDQLVPVLEGERTPRRPVAAVTFDDGYADVYHNGFPLLRRKGIPSAFFVVTDLVGSPGLQIHDELFLLLSTVARQWRDVAPALANCLRQAGLPEQLTRRVSEGGDPFLQTRLLLENLGRAELDAVAGVLRERVQVDEATLNELRAVDWDMLREMRDNGVTIGSHTKSHKLLAHESWNTMLEELKVSRRTLERRLGIRDRHFAYPDGCFNADTLRAVAAAGYPYAYTTCLHRDARQPMLTIPRRCLWENSSMNGFGRFSPAIMSCQVNGIFDPASRCQQQHWPREQELMSEEV